MNIGFHFACIRQFWDERLHKTYRIMLIALVIAIAAGYATCISSPEITTTILDSFMEAVIDTGIIDETGAISPFGLLMNNWMAMLLCVVYGFLPFLFLPLLVLFSNSYLIGAMGAYYEIQGISMKAFLAGIIPHGIFELPALALAAAMGFILCITIIKKLLHSPGTPPMGELVSDILRTLLLAVFPLLVAAAAIEATVTPMVMEMFL